MKKTWLFLASMAVVFSVMSCNDGLTGHRGDQGSGKKPGRSQRTVIDNAEYVDFTVEKYNAHTARKEDVLHTLGGFTFKNGNSLIRIKPMEGTIEISSDVGNFNGKDNCQVYGVFVFDVKAASSDCLYINKDTRKEGFLLIDGTMFRNDAVPDLAVCLPLYGYSRNRIEVSPVMDGYIAMPSGTYWKQK
jgi:hypothetical protein